jgi:hypothetical protein
MGIVSKCANTSTYIVMPEIAFQYCITYLGGPSRLITDSSNAVYRVTEPLDV